VGCCCLADAVASDAGSMLLRECHGAQLAATDCAPCLHPCAPLLPQIVRAAGPKWQLVWQLTQLPIWPELLAGKKAVMVPDDDVILDTCAINRCCTG